MSRYVRPGRRLRSRIVAVAVLGLLAPLLAVASSSAAPTRPAAAAPTKAASAPVKTGAAGAAARDNYTPPSGVKINNPLGGKRAKRRNIRHINRTIDSTPRGQKITVASWNIRAWSFTMALIRAHRRGVTVRVVMAYSNANPPKHPNPQFFRMYRAFKKGNKKRPKSRRSWIRRCRGACRGPHGIAHTKTYLFSKAGKRRNIIIYGSNNATDTAARWQWNDLYTLKGKPRMYRGLRNVILKMGRDNGAKQPFRMWGNKKVRLFTYPYAGKGTPGDPILRNLKRVKCRGAKNTRHGRTVIRIAQTAMTYKRGKRLANRLRKMKNNGCDIRVIYAMFGNGVLKALGPIPRRHLAVDWDGDGLYDRYLHTKIMTVRGHYKKSRKASFVWNGSANLTTNALLSDEVLGRITIPRVVRRYQKWINHLFNNPPRRPTQYRTVNGRLQPIQPPDVDDPYANIRRELLG